MSWRRFARRFLSVALALSTTACSLAVDGNKLFGSKTRRVVLEVVYGPGAEPLVKRSDGTLPFTRLQKNLERLFEGTGKTLEVPTRLEQMRLEPDLTAKDLTMDDIARIGLHERRTEPNDDTAVFVFVYVPGSINADPLELGDTRSFSGVTGIAAGTMRARFHSASNLDLAADIEQIVLIHELGHEVGLVNGGLAMATPHEDKGHHCKNERCVMHAPSGLATESLPSFASDDATVLFGDECLADVAAVAAKP